jgi:cell division septation protein DedD
MIRPKLVVVNNDRDEQPRSYREGRGYRLDLSGKKLVLGTLSLVLSLCFMFTLGVFVGRGVPLVSADDFSIRGVVLQFLGLEKQTGRPSPRAAATWEDPRKMLESLNYYEDLTHKGGTPIAAAPKAIEPAAAVPAAEPAKEPVRRAAAVSRPAEKTSAPQPERLQAAGSGTGQYMLLVASLKEPDTQALLDKLRAKGYSPRIESLDLGAAKWNRILLGSFPSRDAAIMFADEFNRKENMEAMVVSSSN